MMTQNKLRELLAYNKDSGVFEWLRSGSGRTSKIAGRRDSNGYITIGIEGKVYGAHRLAWLYINGVMPDMIDHKDRVRDNNKILNLRLSNHSENAMNCKPRINNQLGEVGVRKTKSGRYTATIKREHLGTFKTRDEAIEARKIAELKLKKELKWV